MNILQIMTENEHHMCCTLFIVGTICFFIGVIFLGIILSGKLPTYKKEKDLSRIYKLPGLDSTQKKK